MSCLIRGTSRTDAGRRRWWSVRKVTRAVVTDRQVTLTELKLHTQTRFLLQFFTENRNRRVKVCHFSTPEEDPAPLITKQSRVPQGETRRDESNGPNLVEIANRLFGALINYILSASACADQKPEKKSSTSSSGEDRGRPSSRSAVWGAFSWRILMSKQVILSLHFLFSDKIREYSKHEFPMQQNAQGLPSFHPKEFDSGRYATEDSRGRLLRVFVIYN